MESRSRVKNFEQSQKPDGGRLSGIAEYGWYRAGIVSPHSEQAPPAYRPDGGAMTMNRHDDNAELNSGPDVRVLI